MEDNSTASKSSRNRINRIIADCHPIEMVGTFYPDKRKGYSESRAELSLARKSARRIYERRGVLAKNLVQFRREDSKTAVNMALTRSSLSPVTYSGYHRYIQLIAERNGGWDRYMDMLDRDLHHIKESRSRFMTRALVALAAYIISFIVVLALPMGATMEGIVFGALTAAFAIASYIWVRPVAIAARENRAKMGPNSTDYDTFARSYDTW